MIYNNTIIVIITPSWGRYSKIPAQLCSAVSRRPGSAGSIRRGSGRCRRKSQGSGAVLVMESWDQLVGNGWVAGGWWDDDITSDDWDHSWKFPAFSTSKLALMDIEIFHQNQQGQVTVKSLLNFTRNGPCCHETWTVQCESQDKCCQLRPDWYKSHVRQSPSNALIFILNVGDFFPFETAWNHSHGVGLPTCPDFSSAMQRPQVVGMPCSSWTESPMQRHGSGALPRHFQLIPKSTLW